MAMTLHVDIVSAEELIYSDTAEAVFAPAEQGEVGVLPRHSPLIARLIPGQVRVKLPFKEEEIFVYVSGGMIEIQPHVVTILADTAIRAHDIDEAAALEAKKRAEEAISGAKSDFNYASAQAELAEAAAQLRTLQNLRKKAQINH